MGRDSAAISTLKKFYKDKTSLPDPQDFIAEIKNTNDRALVIILAALIDDGLEFHLMDKMRKMPPKAYQEAFKFESPLGTFSARIDICYYFKFINEDLRGRLHDLREMRNACAHAKRPISFKNKELLNVAKRFLEGAMMVPKDDSIPNIRTTMIAECVFLYSSLVNGSEIALQEAREALVNAGYKLGA